LSSKTTGDRARPIRPAQTLRVRRPADSDLARAHRRAQNLAGRIWLGQAANTMAAETGNIRVQGPGGGDTRTRRVRPAELGIHTPCGNIGVSRNPGAAFLPGHAMTHMTRRAAGLRSPDDRTCGELGQLARAKGHRGRRGTILRPYDDSYLAC